MSQQLDRGLLYGDGFFTTVLVLSGQLANWSAHWQRLQLSAQRLKFPALSETEILSRVAAELTDVDEDYAVVKILVSRGQGGIGYQPLPKSKPVIYVQKLAFPNWIKNAQAWPLFPVKMTLSEIRCAQQPLLAGLKHCNRLENVMAREALIGSTYDDALMLGQQDDVISATQANLVLVKANQLITPELGHSGVMGTCLSRLPSALKKAQWQWQIRPVTLDDVYQAEELFCCNAVRGVMPVTQFQQQSYRTNKTHQIAQAWQEWQSQNLTSV
ncbi:aminodeoxychorismate lyase [Hydrogenovibrio sp. SC-1]|uniref:aminodeoxychorismate lyase n=1 Tax=Hydrogenovibrio sp. SC-1 TaxID=2065820 RepID=UPI000C7A88FC|nr:aminodeoxychorismate lyase [Hydrogenovibrio sp. SC-1]PLA74725.1 aminodeoxychorismate lyase [Hydrogenovibrio sp. SC-1]